MGDELAEELGGPDHPVPVTIGEMIPVNTQEAEEEMVDLPQPSEPETEVTAAPELTPVHPPPVCPNPWKPLQGTERGEEKFWKTK